MSRRGVIALGAVASALVVGGRVKADSIRTGGGISGGGWATWEGGEAQFSVFGSTFTGLERDAPTIFGTFRWADAAGTTLTSETIRSYGAIEPVETTRELRGDLRNSNGATLHPFSLTMVEGGGPGEGLDRLTLVVGPAVDEPATPVAGDGEVDPATAVIELNAVIEVGDLQLLTFEFPE